MTIAASPPNMVNSKPTTAGCNTPLRGQDLPTTMNLSRHRSGSSYPDWALPGIASPVDQVHHIYRYTG